MRKDDQKLKFLYLVAISLGLVLGLGHASRETRAQESSLKAPSSNASEIHDSESLEFFNDLKSAIGEKSSTELDPKLEAALARIREKQEWLGPKAYAAEEKRVRGTISSAYARVIELKAAMGGALDPLEEDILRSNPGALQASPPLLLEPSQSDERIGFLRTLSKDVDNSMNEASKLTYLVMSQDPIARAKRNKVEAQVRKITDLRLELEALKQRILYLNKLDKLVDQEISDRQKPSWAKEEAGEPPELSEIRKLLVSPEITNAQEARSIESLKAKELAKEKREMSEKLVEQLRKNLAEYLRDLSPREQIELARKLGSTVYGRASQASNGLETEHSNHLSLSNLIAQIQVVNNRIQIPQSEQDGLASADLIKQLNQKLVDFSNQLDRLRNPEVSHYQTSMDIQVKLFGDRIAEKFDQILKEDQNGLKKYSDSFLTNEVRNKINLEIKNLKSASAELKDKQKNAAKIVEGVNLSRPPDYEFKVVCP